MEALTRAVSASMAGPSVEPDRLRYKDALSFEARSKESAAVRARMPDRVPVIVERGSRAATVPLLDKSKYMVPADLTVGQFIHVIRRRLALSPETAVFVFFGNELPTTGTTMREMYARRRDEDGFLYATYCGENTFGVETENRSVVTSVHVARSHGTAPACQQARGHRARRRQAACRALVIGTARALACGICSRTCHADTVEVDHVIPHSVSQDDSAQNLWPLCRDCHCVKTRAERGMLMYALRGSERDCWVCKRRVSRFFIRGLYCDDCVRAHASCAEAAKARVRCDVMARNARLLEECRDVADTRLHNSWY